MKFKISALSEQHFKATVTAKIPTNEIGQGGKTVYGTAKFVALFRCISTSKARANLKELEELRKEDKHVEAIELGAKQTASLFVGFEPVKGNDLPFTDDEGAAIPDSIEARHALLECMEIRDAIQEAYQKAREGDVNGKNSKR